MPWEDRLKQAAYISPTGTRFEFDYEEVGVLTKKKAAVFEYPQRRGAYIQDLKVGARRFPIRAFIHGADYDLEANGFYDALEEDGYGTLEHPLYGTRTVFPLTISRRDSLVSAANQAIVEIEFIENTLDPSPLASEDQLSLVRQTAAQFDILAPEQLSENLEDATPTGFQKFTQALKQANKFVVQYVRPVLVANGMDTTTFDRVAQGIDFTTNVTAGDVQAVSAQLNSLIRAGASATAGGPAAYIDLGNALINTAYDGPEQFDLISFASEATVNAMAVSTGSTDHQTRAQAVNDSDALVSLGNAVVNWQDTNG